VKPFTRNDRKQLTEDLDYLSDIMENIMRDTVRMTPADKIDVAARFRAAAKTIEKFDENLKTYVKEHLKHVAGEVPGYQFKAVLQIVPTNLLNQEALKADKPSLVAEYTRTKDVERVSFEPR